MHILLILNDIVSGGEDVEGDPARFHLCHPPRGTSQSWFWSVFVYLSFSCFLSFVFPIRHSKLLSVNFSSPSFFFIAIPLGLRLIVLFVLQMFLSLVLGLV